MIGIGGICGDVIGSVYEWNSVKSKDFPLFIEPTDALNMKLKRNKSTYTDDTVMTVATMWALLNNKSYEEAYQKFGREYTDCGYGKSFQEWIKSDNPQPYNSWGNGSAMRVGPIGYLGNISNVIEESKKSAEVTHNHIEGIKGAQAISIAIYGSLNGATKENIKEDTTIAFDYNLDRTLDEIRPTYKFDVSCQGSVPEAIIAFLESTDYEDAIRNAISIGGDSDTIACITGSIAEAYYKEIPDHIVEKVLTILPQEFIDIIEEFSKTFQKL